MYMGPPLNNAEPTPKVLFSMNAMRRAWQQVRRGGGSSPGSDGVKPKQFEQGLNGNLNRLRQQILGGTYEPQPVRRFFIKKASGKQRPISLWSVRDRVAQRVVHDYLMVKWDPMFLNCSYGFRPGKGIDHAVAAIVDGHKAGLPWVLDADIADCFGSIPLDILIGQVKRSVRSDMVVKLVESWLQAPIKGSRTGEVAGVSQGGVISPHLANLYLHRFDEMIVAALPQSRLIRFADDFIILNRSEQESVWSLDVARRSLANLRLTMNMRKTQLVTFEEGFSFLGVTFEGNRILRKHQTDEGG